MLSQVPDQRLRAFIIWEPVIASDLGPPTSFVLSLVSDPRAVQFWDGSRSLSEFIVTTEENSWLEEPGESPSPDMIVWDLVAVFSPGMVWRSHEPPTSHCGPVVKCIEEIRADLLAHVK
jgi:hypothetical protein